MKPKKTIAAHLAALVMCLLASSEIAYAQTSAPTRTPCETMLERWNGIAVEPITEWRYREAGPPLAGGEALDLDDSKWDISTKDTAWQSTTLWLRRWVEIPAQRGGYDLRGGRFVLHIRGSWAATEYFSVFVNGAHRGQGHELEPLVLTESAEPGQKFLIAIRLQQAAGRFRPVSARVELSGVPGRPNVQTLLEECVAAELLNAASGEGKETREQAIDSARKEMDWAALDRGDQRRFDDSLRRAREKLASLHDWLKGHSITAVGNAHIDMAWLWPWTETVEVVRNTFSSVLKLMQEFPELKFSHSSAQTYAWMEEKYPGLFEEIRRRVREGRWEIVGGMWVEPDLNMPDGESLVRQLLVGKRYFREKFGVDVNIGYNPDSFGYNWQLPQIYKKAGIDYFVTQKIYWNETTKFPHKLFWWEAPDGSRLLTFFPHDYVNELAPIRMARDMADTRRISGLPHMLHLYGIGDHGGGPTRAMLESGRKWQAPGALFPRLKLGTLADYFEQARSDAARTNIPVWKDELYLEYHRGTFTTQGHTKRNNRRNEVLLLNAEKFSSLVSLFGETYPQAALNESWRKLLFNQFHDILPGSSITPVYIDASRDHAEIGRVAGGALITALDEIVARVNTRGAGIPLVVFNPLGWERTGVVEISVPLVATQVEVRGPNGVPAIAEVVTREPGANRMRVRFVAEAVPAIGYKTFRVVAASGARPAQAALKVTDNQMENEFLRVRVDPTSGCISSLFDKKAGREVLAAGACGNLLQAFRDKPKDWDAWNIDATFEDEKWDLIAAEEVKVTERGPVRAIIRVTKKFQKSRFVQEIILYSKVPRVDIRTQADWHEERILIKAAFPVAAKSDFATFEIPYGAIRRPTTRNTPAEKAKFEVPAIRWADLSDANGGLSVLNDSKYGYDAKGNVLRISLLRSPKWPDPNADMGEHEFTYSLYPHAGSWVEAGTVRQGYELNYPLLAVVTQPHSGSLPLAHSFISLSPDNLVLTAVKKAEDDDTWILRFYEFAGLETQARLRLPRDVVRAQETNLMENPERDLEVRGAEVLVSAKPFEIKTVRVQLSPNPRPPWVY